MTDHLSFESLCDLADDALAPVADAAARSHLRSCEDCASRLSAITALAASTAALPREIAPPADLWTDIRADVSSRASARGSRMSAWRLRHLLAAGVVVAVASSAVTALIL